MFKVTPTAKVIWRQGLSLVSCDRMEEQGIELGTPGYKASDLPTIPLLVCCCPPLCIWVLGLAMVMVLWCGSIYPSLFVNHFAKEENSDYLLHVFLHLCKLYVSLLNLSVFKSLFLLSPLVGL